MSFLRVSRDGTLEGASNFDDFSFSLFFNGIILCTVYTAGGKLLRVMDLTICSLVCTADQRDFGGTASNTAIYSRKVLHL